MIRELNTVKEIEFAEICNRVEIGNFASKFETLEGNTFIVKNDKLLTLTKKDWYDSALVFKLPPKFTQARICGNYLYLIHDSQIFRYTSSHENLFNEELIIDIAHSIDSLILSPSAVLVLIKNELKDMQYSFFINKNPVPKKI